MGVTSKYWKAKVIKPKLKVKNPKAFKKGYDAGFKDGKKNAFTPTKLGKTRSWCNGYYEGWLKGNMKFSKK